MPTSRLRRLRQFPASLAALVTAASHSERAARHDDAGQATAEYALVLLGAALVALLVVAWATGGGGAGKIGHLLDHVIDSVESHL